MRSETIPREENPPRDPEFLTRLEKLVSKAGSRTALARAAGIAATTLQNWLDGNTEPSRSSLLRLARAGEVAIAWLTEGRGPELAGAPPPSYLEVVTYDLRKTGSLLRAMIGTPAEKRLIYQPDITHLASIQGTVAAVVATGDLEFPPEVPPDSVLLYDQMRRNPLVPSLVTTWDTDERSIYFVADGIRLKTAASAAPQGFGPVDDPRRRERADLDRRPRRLRPVRSRHLGSRGAAVRAAFHRAVRSAAGCRARLAG